MDLVRSFCIGFSLVWALCAVACGEQAVSGRELASVHSCDELAAHPRDPGRMAPGVPLEEVVPRAALAACEAAAGDHAATPRFHYQLGRALAAAGRYAEARERFEGAAAEGYAAAWESLGWMHAKGLGVPADLERAADAFRKALEAGFPSEQSLAAVVFSPEGYRNASLLTGIDAGRPLAGSALEEQAIYIVEFLDAAEPTCGRVLSNQARVRLNVAGRSQTMRSALETIFGAGARAQTQNPIAAGNEAGEAMVQGIAATSDAARADFEIFVERHGCDSPVAERFFSNLDRALRS